MNKITDQMLMDYLDGRLNPTERALVDSNLDNTGVKYRLDAFRLADKVVHGHLEIGNPGSYFTDRVMNSISELEPMPAKRIDNGLIFAIITAICSLSAGLYFGTGKYFNFDVFVDSLQTSFDYAHLTYGLLAALLISTMWLLDKVLLRPAFRSH
jgi:hypothetical protein